MPVVLTLVMGMCLGSLFFYFPVYFRNFMLNYFLKRMKLKGEEEGKVLDMVIKKETKLETCFALLIPSLLIHKMKSYFKLELNI